MIDNAPFIFADYRFFPATCTLRLTYRYDGGPEFVEEIRFPAITRALAEADYTALDYTFRLLFILAGVSYYKAYAPTHLRCDAFNLDAPTAEFATKVYRHGLGEFAYNNRLDLRDLINIEHKVAASPQPLRLKLARHLCIPVGGGKDSIVTLEALKNSGTPITLFALASPGGTAGPIAATIAVSGLPAVTVERRISPALIELNKNGAMNGHVPITAILSVIALAVAIMQAFDSVVMSNEHSASVPNMVYNGVEINHQYSKSVEFENDLAAYIAAHISPDLHYYSFLRSLSETAILQRFSKLPRYFDVFRSCNTAFRQDTAMRGTHWCGNCPKCRFVFLGLAPFIEKQKLVSIFGKNMLVDTAQMEGFAELCGLGAHKPFECVGEIEESALLMEKLYQTDEWKTDAVVASLGARVATRAANFDRSYDDLFIPNAAHNVPLGYIKLLDDAG